MNFPGAASADLGRAALWCACITAGALLLGCGSKGPPAATVDAKSRLQKLFELYEEYTNKYRKPPADEKTFKDFIAKLPKETREQMLLGEDVDALLTSPRDGKKFVIRYGTPIDRAVTNRAVMWEDQGKNGQRLVALSIGYIEEYDEESFKQYRK